jgi:Uma2 family endonuclease
LRVVSIEIAQVYRFSLDEYHRLELPDDARVELLEGVLIAMGRRSREHERAVRWLSSRIYRSVDPDRFIVGVAAPVTLDSSGSEPEPDLFIATRDDPGPHHPAYPKLVIEVAMSSLRTDMIVKQRIYALAGVMEYWVVDLHGRRLVRHRGPDGVVYRSVDEVRDVLVASAVELPPLDLRELFDDAFS